jgi:phospholipase/carboxylesterase
VQPLEDAGKSVAGQGLPPEHEHVRQRLAQACELVLDSINVFGSGGDTASAFMAVLKALRKHCQAQETLFPLRHDFSELDRYFLEPGADPEEKPQGKDQGIKTSIIHTGLDPDLYARGGYSLFVPESDAPDTGWPLVVALHGGYGHGRDFLWTWLREARSRGFVLLAPTSKGRTWSIANSATDALQLIKHIKEVCEKVPIDKERILLSGMSDGGTFALSFGLQQDSPARAIAPVSCVLATGEMAHAGHRRIYWVHGALDWMFPPARAVQACKDLSLAGADVRLKLVPDLSHAYPREENDSILTWFDAALALKSP